MTQRHGLRIVNTIAGAYVETLTPETQGGHYEAGFDLGDLVLTWETEAAPVRLSDMTDEEIIAFFDGDHGKVTE